MARLSTADIASLVKLCSGGVAQDVDLSSISQWRIGGRADVIVRPTSHDEVMRLMDWFRGKGIEPLVIGLTSTLLFSDDGLRMPCIQIGTGMADVRIEGTTIHAEAGVWVPGFARRLMKNGLTGVEHICGIPGTLGGLVCMNGGSQRKGIGTHVASVRSVTRFGREVVRDWTACGFAYRRSVYQTNSEVITEVTLQLQAGVRDEIRHEMRGILASRRKKFPRKQPNCGSVFKSDPAMYDEIGPPGAAIEKVGLKGAREGGALVSPFHANFIVNTGSATARDVLTLLRRVSDAVEKTTGYRMATEVLSVSADGRLSTLHP